MSLRVAVVSLVATIIMAGCGSDDSGADSSGGTENGGGKLETSEFSKSAFTKRAEEICSKGNERLLTKLGAYLTENRSRSKGQGELTAEAVKRTVVPGVEAQIEEIEELGAPSGDEADVEAFLAAQQRSLDSLKARRRLALETDLSPAFRQAGSLARQYGLDACAYD